MSFTWFMLGILTIGSGYFLYAYSQQNQLHWLAWSGLILGIFSIFFSIAWGVGAILEGVPRAASMGLLIFGLGGIMVLTLAVRFAARRHR